ncbi:MAG: hypothetical protein LBC61_01600, partial [Candidatus Peribacteria bacterium]|nr:hypothetical protein [Candidatus Peribacteria bacterium]
TSQEIFIEGFKVFAQTTHFAGQAIQGFHLINCKASIFLINSWLFLPKAQLVTSIHLTIPSGSIMNVHLPAFPSSHNKL